MKNSIKWIAAAAAIFSSFTLAHAQTLSVNCNYPVSVAANIPTGSAEIQTDLKKGGKFPLSFIVEKGASTAYFSGNAGAVKVNAIWGNKKITFVEITKTGTVQVTTVYGVQLNTLHGSVHSRASGGKGYELPSQYYGACIIK